MGENLGELRFGNVFLDTTPKVRSMKDKKRKKKRTLKTSALQKTLLRECKDMPQTRRKYFQNTQLIKDCIQNIQRTSKTQH